MKEVFDMPINIKDFQKIIIDSYSEDSLSKIEDQVKKFKSENLDRKIIGVFITHDKEYYKNNDDFQPYYYLKYLFIRNELPLQAITIEKLKGYDGLKWAASNIALGIFSKLGGCPWKVKSSNDNCLIFGIGQAHRKAKNSNKIEKYFSYSVCFNSSGVYRSIDILGNSTNNDSYLKELRTNIETVLKESIEKGTVDKCVIHLPFKIRKVEIKKILNCIDSFDDQIDFQVIKINTINKYFGYSNNPSKVPYESSLVQLGKNEYLIWFEGYNIIKKL